MNKFLNYIGLLLIILCISGCAKDIVDVTGAITGRVKNNSGKFIDNCNVSLSPGGQSVITGSDGSFTFTSLSVGSYNLAFTKQGYKDLTKTVSVVASETTNADVILESNGTFSISTTTLDFADTSTELTLQFANATGGDCSCTVGNLPKWADVSEANFTVADTETKLIKVTINRDLLEFGSFNQNIDITYSGAKSGKFTVNLKATKNKPEVKISSSASNVTYNSLSVSGQVVSTSGYSVTYGFCWGTKSGVTVNDNMKDLGTTDSPKSFDMTLDNLASETKYYIKAFAKNESGVVYSDEITATTAVDESFKASPTNLSFASTGGQANVDITAEKSWSAKTTDSWISLNKTSGSGNSTIAITASANSSDSRTGTVTITSGNKSITVSVKQNGQMTVSPTSCSFTSSGGDKTITVTADTSWSVSSDSQWLTSNKTTGSNNGTFVITAAKNNSTSSRSGRVTVKNSTTSKTITVTQSGSSYVSKDGYGNDVKF